MAKKNKVDQKVIIVGGGLAGLTAAIELAELGYDITLYESSDHLGGKAAGLDDNRVYDGNMCLLEDTVAHEIQSDHGYHIFPLWYVNMRQLWTRIGLTPDEVYESGEYYGLQRGNTYNFTPPQPKSEREMFSLLDLVTREDKEVDDLTFRGFLYSRIYNDLDSVSLNQLFLNALSIPEYDISSRVVRNLFRQWLPVIKQKNWAGLKGPLGKILIDKMEQKARDAAKASGGSFSVRLDCGLQRITLDKGRPVLKFSGLNKPVKAGDTPVIMAVPFEVLGAMQTDELYSAEPAFSQFSYLRANQFGALDIYFKEKLPNVPIDHFDLVDSRFNLSAFDISQHWPVFTEEKRFEGTVLQFVAGSCKDLNGLSEAAFTREMVNEIVHYLPAATPDGIEYIVPHPNADQRLFVNDVGTWDHRPEPRGNIFYFAGDYVRNDTDIASMEGAVRSGMNAAEAVRTAHTPMTKPVQILPAMGFSDAQLAEMRQEKVVPGRLLMFLKYRLKELLDDI